MFACSSHRTKAKTLLFSTLVFYIKNAQADVHGVATPFIIFLQQTKFYFAL
jgi:hypothetical protein